MGRPPIEMEHAQLRFETGPFGIHAALLLLSGVVVVLAGFYPENFRTTADTIAPLRAFLDYTTIAGYWPIGWILGAWLAFDAVGVLWRDIDRVAATAGAEGIAFHPTLRQRPLRWAEIDSVEMTPPRRIFSVNKTLLVTWSEPGERSRGASRVTLAPIEEGDDRHERFLTFASERMDAR